MNVSAEGFSALFFYSAMADYWSKIGSRLYFLLVRGGILRKNSYICENKLELTHKLLWQLSVSVFLLRAVMLRV